MNKRIRKKHLKRTMRQLAAAYEEYEMARESVFHLALEKVADTYGTSREESMAALRCYLEIACIMAFSGPPPRA